MNKQNELAVVDKQELSVDRPSPTAGDMLNAILSAIKSGEVTAEKVAAMDGAMKLCERMQDKEAEKEAAKAFNLLQVEMPNVQATKSIPSKDGTMRSSFAPFEQIDKQARPLCLKHGFTYSFAEGEFQQGRITKVCTLQHSGGHKRSNQFTVRVGSGPPGCSESQADGAAHSYAKRGALCDCLNIVVHGIDNDARLEGGKITKDQVEELSRRVELLNADKDRFLKLAGAASYAEIHAMKYDLLDEFLRIKERKGK